VRALLVGTGAVGTRSARQLLSSSLVSELIVFSRPGHALRRPNAIGSPEMVKAEELAPKAYELALSGASFVILAAPRLGAGLARAAIDAGVPLVSVSDDPADVRALLALNDVAARRGVPVVAGAGMAPGLSCLFASWAVAGLEEVMEVHVATLGTGGPACARRRHAALGEVVEEWSDGAWVRKVGGSGRELVWFPDGPSADCYRVNRPDATLLVRAFPSLRRATSRAAASRRDRTTSWLPMLRRPHPEGTVGAVRVDVRGRRAGVAQSVVIGASGRPAVLAGIVAASLALKAAQGELIAGAGGVGSLVKRPGELLAELASHGLRAMKFEGAHATAPW